MNPIHVCTLENRKKEDTRLTKLGYFTHISEYNPRTKLHFRSLESIDKERQRLKDLKLKWIIHPFSLFRMYWEISVCLIYFISLVIIPIIVSFGETVTDGLDRNTFTLELGKSEYFFDFINILDVIFRFVTGIFFKHRNTVVIHPGSIARIQFQKMSFYTDIICCIPVQPIIQTLANKSMLEEHHPSIKYVKFSSLIKVCRFIKIIEYTKNANELSRHHSFLRNSFSYCLKVLLMLHWLTCIYIIILKFIYIRDTEFYLHDLDNDYLLVYSFFEIYTKSLFRVTSYLLNICMTSGTVETMTFSLKTIQEEIVFIVYSILGFICSNYMLVIITHMVKILNSSKIKYYSIMSQLNKYMEFKGLPKDMKGRILSYYEFRYQKKYFRETTILDMLSETLRRDINLYSCRTLIETVSLLKELPPDTISEVVSFLKRDVFLYDDIIVKAGTAGDCMYFIGNGTVAVSTQTGKEICHLQDGAYFGEIALISADQKRVANVIAIEICEIFRLDRKHFNNCFPETSAFYKKIERIARERVQKTKLLEELHKKYIIESTTKRRAAE